MNTRAKTSYESLNTNKNVLTTAFLRVATAKRSLTAR